MAGAVLSRLTSIPPVFLTCNARLKISGRAKRKDSDSWDYYTFESFSASTNFSTKSNLIGIISPRAPAVPSRLPGRER